MSKRDKTITIKKIIQHTGFIRTSSNNNIIVNATGDKRRPFGSGVRNRSSGVRQDTERVIVVIMETIYGVVYSCCPQGNLHGAKCDSAEDIVGAAPSGSLASAS